MDMAKLIEVFNIVETLTTVELPGRFSENLDDQVKNHVNNDEKEEQRVKKAGTPTWEPNWEV